MRSRMRARRAGRAAVAAAALVMLAAAGCVQVKETLTINPDGSGTVRIETATYMQSSLYSMLLEFLPEQTLAYPPVTRTMTKQLFPGDEFTLDITRNRAVPHTTGVIVEVQFKDINALINSPYGAVHSLELVREGDQLVLKARSGLQTVARLGPFLKAERDDKGPLNLDTVRDKYGELAFDFTIVMPAEAHVDGAGATVNGNAVTWSAALAGTEDEAKVLDELDSVVTIRCSAKDVTFEPAKTTRLDLVPFAQLKAQPIGEAPAVDLDKIKAAAKFVPLVLQVTQSFNLVGQGFSGENCARLYGIVVVPRELQPAQWGDATLELVEDDQGEDLMMQEDEDARRYRRSRLGYERDVISSRRGKSGEEPSEVTHPVTLLFAPPSFEAQKIAHLKASITMRYPGGTHLVCIKDAITKDQIEDASLQEVYERGFLYTSYNEEREDGLESILDEHGVKLWPRRIGRSGGIVVMDFLVQAEAGGVLQAQVFDAGGRAWPTSLGGSRYSRVAGALRICVAGEPEPPLSLALIVNGAGPAVEVPIELKDVPIAPAETEAGGSAEASAATAKDEAEGE